MKRIKVPKGAKEALGWLAEVDQGQIMYVGKYKGSDVFAWQSFSNALLGYPHYAIECKNGFYRELDPSELDSVLKDIQRI